MSFNMCFVEGTTESQCLAIEQILFGQIVEVAPKDAAAGDRYPANMMGSVNGG
jgi:hypothetical protein